MSAKILTIPEPTLRLEPLGDWIAVALSHQSHTDNFGAGGIIMPEAWTIALTKYRCGTCQSEFTLRSADMQALCPSCRNGATAIDATQIGEKADESTSGDHYATVLGVGPEVSGIEFGMRVQVTRWADGQWFYGWPADLPRIAEDQVHPSRRVAVAAKARFAYVKPSDIVFILTDFAGLAGWPQGLPVGMYPGPGRVHLRHDAPRGLAFGLSDIQRSPFPTPYATVIAVWEGTGLEPGMRVLTADRPCCTFWPQDGTVYSMMLAGDVVAVEAPALAQEATA